MANRHPPHPSKPLQPRTFTHSSNPDVFSDDFALESLQMDDALQRVRLNRSPASEAPRHSSSSQRAIESPAGSIRRSRLSQRSAGLDSLRFDDRASQVSRPRSVISNSDLDRTNSTAQRSVHTMSSFGFPRAQSPYQGATGPSHPYAMYSQNSVVTRTPSVATSSTIRRPERSYSGPNGPTQPYAMYSQNTVPEDGQDPFADGLAPPMVPGFPGLRQNYRRRLGPDGEDADDLIGPDGYTEQLPPYTRYANSIPPKYDSQAASVRSDPTGQREDSQPEDSEENLHRLQTRDAAAAVNPFDDSSTQLSSTTAVEVLPKEEGGSFKEKVREKGRRRVCCRVLPCWIVVVVVVLFLAVLLGGIIGGVVAHHDGVKKGYENAIQTVTAVTAAETAPTATVTTTSPADAMPISTPANLPTLPTGSYSVALINPSTNTNSCLIDSAQSSAWDCSTGADLTIDVNMAGPHVPVVSITYLQPPNALRYGSQPPELDGQTNLMLMKDRNEWNRGPAYFFQQSYNKTVIVREKDMPPGYPNSKLSTGGMFRRWISGGQDADGFVDLHERDQSDWAENQYASITDKPWFCFWNETMLEGFIYVTQNEAGNPRQSAAVPTGASSVLSGTNSVAPSGTSAGYKRQQPTPATIHYPKVVKLEERRLYQNAVQPYCQQMQILNNYQPGPLTDPSNGKLIQIQLNESEPLAQKQMIHNGGYGVPSAQGTPFPSLRRSVKRQNPQIPSNCMCEWQSV